MTNLDIIKYLATNNPVRLGELLDDIYCGAYNDGYVDDWDAKPNFKELLFKDASESSMSFSNHELEEWSKVNDRFIRNCLNCAHLGDPMIWCDACDDFEYWEEEK